ncbi:polysaccharide lyase family 8 super-sandwich domain-containing protein [Planctomycetota bacterium]
MKLILLCISMLWLVSAHANELDLIRKQYCAYTVQQREGDEEAGRLMEAMKADGTSPDVDYASTRPGEWPTRTHLDYLVEMASAYADPESRFYQDETMQQTVLLGLDHWIAKDYQNSNWYNGQIGVPYRLGSAMLLMGAAIPDTMLTRAHPIFDRSELGQTGQNKVWCAGIGVMKGLLYEDRTLLKTAVDDIWSELIVSTGEGIQPDWSFHQHGPQFQMGNYGLSFGEDMIQWAAVLRGTGHALSGEQLAVLRHYFLDGACWMIWDGHMDYSACGRQMEAGAQRSKGNQVLRQLQNMMLIDPELKTDYEKRMANDLIGFKPFWRSEIGIQRRPDWYASVKMSSSRMIGSETCNSENMLGLHLGDGLALVYQDGTEYKDIVPLWDWNRLPGTTCDQAYGDLKPKDFLKYRSPSDFCGVLGHDESGLAAMIYQREKLEARKAWFFEPDSIICLGAGIQGETIGPVFTSIQQSWLRGKAEQDTDLIHHDQTGYRFLDGEPTLKTDLVTGNWTSSYPDRPDRSAEGKVFSIWIDHGKAPQDSSYAYIIYPQVSTADYMNETIASDQTKVLSNTPAIGAIENERGVYAVFYDTGTLQSSKGSIEVDAPCLFHLTETQLIISDLQHKSPAISVSINGQKKTISLPQDDDSGKQVSLDL